MHCRNFILNSILGIFFFFSINSYTQSSASKFSTQELLGKKTPTLEGNGYKLRKEASRAFLKMKKHAAKDGINIKVVSSYRSNSHQNRIWTRKYKRFRKQGFAPMKTIEKIIQYSTIPGTSRHHWGTDLDIIDGNQKRPRNVLLQRNFNPKGAYRKLKIWMDKHAHTYGFYLVYTNKKNRRGFKYEPWHYTYAPLSVPMLKAYNKLNISEELKNDIILGSDYFSEEFIKKYIFENILDINPKLLL